MFSIKIQIRANIRNIQISDELVTNNISDNVEDIRFTIGRALGPFLSDVTVDRIAKHTMVAMSKAKNCEKYKQIIEQNINGCAFKIFIKIN